MIDDRNACAERYRDCLLQEAARHCDGTDMATIVQAVSNACAYERRQFARSAAATPQEQSAFCARLVRAEPQRIARYVEIARRPRYCPAIAGARLGSVRPGRHQ